VDKRLITVDIKEEKWSWKKPY